MRNTWLKELVEELNKGGFDHINEGSVYPIVIRLEKKALIKSIKKSSPLGPKRKYYYLTELGVEQLESFLSEWHVVQKNVTYFIESYGEGGRNNEA